MLVDSGGSTGANIDWWTYRIFAHGRRCDWSHLRLRLFNFRAAVLLGRSFSRSVRTTFISAADCRPHRLTWNYSSKQLLDRFLLRSVCKLSNNPSSRHIDACDDGWQRKISFRDRGINIDCDTNTEQMPAPTAGQTFDENASRFKGQSSRRDRRLLGQGCRYRLCGRSDHVRSSAF